MYIHHAKNLTTGVPYAETGYVLNPHYPNLGPRSYPPGYPLLLAPLYVWRGLDIGAMRILTILLFVASLPLYFLLIRKDLSHASALVALTVVGFNPVFWAYKEKITSDFAFLPFIYAGLLLIDRYERGEIRRLPWPFLGLIAALVVWFAASVRSVGLTVVPALLLVEVMRRGRVSGFAVLVTAVTAVLVLIQDRVFPAASSYAARLWPIDPGVVWYNAIKYAKSATAVWSNGYFVPLRVALFGLTGLAALWGYFRRTRGHATIIETFIPFYLAAIVIFPGSASRYLFPLIPLFVFHVLTTIEGVTASRAPRIRASALAGFALVALFVYAAMYTSLYNAPIEKSANTPQRDDLFDYIRAATDETDVFVVRRPRVLSLYTGRAASAYHEASDDDLWLYFEDIGVDYLISGPEDPDDYRAFIGRSSDRLMVAHENPEFSVLSVRWDEDVAKPTGE